MTVDQRSSEGSLVLVVGPSGGGKDSLMSTARTRLVDDRRFVFARRIITRESDEASESHDAMTVEAFAAAEAQGAFLLSWRAHGLGYAIPASLGEALDRGQVVVANVSRTSIAAAERRAKSVVVLHVTAPPEVLAERIARRGREPVEAIAQRLQRQAPLTAERAEIIEIVNDGALEPAARRFTEVLQSVADRQRQTAR